MMQQTAPQKIAPPARIPTLRKLSVSDLSTYKRILIIGDHGAGKTQLAGTAVLDPRVRGVQYVDAELRRGAETLSDLLKKYPQKLEITDIVDVPRDMNAVYQFMKAVTSQQGKGDEGVFRPDVLVIDSMTDIAERMLTTISGNDETTEQGTLPRSVQLQQWGTVKLYIENITRQLSTLPCHLIVTCRKVEEVEFESGRVLRYGPRLPGKELMKNYPSMFGQVLYLHTEPNIGNAPPTRVLQSQEDALHKAKDGSHRLPAKIKNPTFTMLLDYFTSERKEQ